ncbi:MAG: MBL fold metallo-hydrolase [Firmicutes bacterium]|nr:MBL fold metallo-hydrolase [Bacillota bacterium]
MALQFCSFASGSSGNSYLVKDDKTAVLVDAGISGKRILQGLEETQTPLEMVSALLITHEHIDHVKSIPVLTKRIPDLRVYANEATWDAIQRPVPEHARQVFETGRDFQVGSLQIRTFPVPHDAAEPVGFSIFGCGRQVSICTDAGCITDQIYGEILDADLLLLEANHEREMLLMGRYPYPLKQRILGDEGHLSNVSAGEILGRITTQRQKKRQVLLGHLSRENNDPNVAMLAVKNTLEEQEIYIGGDLQIQVARRDERSRLYVVE